MMRRPRRWFRAGVAATAVALAIAVGGLWVVSATAAVAEDRIKRAAAFLVSSQNADGGFGEAGFPSDPTLSAWVALALSSADVDAASLRKSGTTLAAYLERQSPELTTDIELHLLARVGLGLDTRALVASLRSEIRPSGRIGPRLNSTIWGILALHAAGETVPKKTVRYVRRNQDRGGGFSFAAKGPPDTNDTAAAIQALRAAGVGANAKPIRRALRYLASARKRSGGFPLVPGKAADAQSTGWVMQAYASAGKPAPRRSPRFLVRLQQADGSLLYRNRQELTPVWVTAQALPGLTGRFFG